MNNMCLKLIVLTASAFAVITLSFRKTAMAQNINLRNGEFITLTCGNNAVNPANPGGDTRCQRELSDLKVELNQAQNDLFNCQNSKPWSCTFMCNDRPQGFGSALTKGEGCRAARKDANTGGCSKEDCVCTRD